MSERIRWDEWLDDLGHRYAWVPRPVSRWLCNWFERRLTKGTPKDE